MPVTWSTIPFVFLFKVRGCKVVPQPFKSFTTSEVADVIKMKYISVMQHEKTSEEAWKLRRFSQPLLPFLEYVSKLATKCAFRINAFNLEQQ